MSEALRRLILGRAYRKPADADGGDGGGGGTGDSAGAGAGAEGGGGGAGAGDAGNGGTADGAGSGVTPTPGDEGQPSAAAWPDNWRESYAQGDEKKLNMLGRYASPNDALNALVAAQNKIRSGELKAQTPFPTDGTDEAKAAWRSEHGIPDKPDGYDLTFDDGLVVGEDDKPVIDHWLGIWHEQNLTPDQVKANVKAYYEFRDKEYEERQAKDAEVQTQVLDALNAEWGQDFRTNMNMVTGLLDTAPEGVKEAVLNSRMADGTPLASNADFIRFLANSAREINPVTTLVPNSGGNVSGAIDDEIAAIEKTMRENRKAYNDDEKMQARYRELLAARERIKK